MDLIRVMEHWCLLDNEFFFLSVPCLLEDNIMYLSPCAAQYILNESTLKYLLKVVADLFDYLPSKRF